MARYLLALGSNLGDRQATLEAALEAIGAVEGTQLLEHSTWHASEPVGGPSGQGEYLNGAVVVVSQLEPHAMLRAVQKIEQQFGRQRGERWAARTLDIDLLLVDDQVIDTPELTIPHPRMASRRFVLEPAAEIASNWVHPLLGCTLAKLRDELDRAG